MLELSLNVLDVAQNSITAGASLIEIAIGIDTLADIMTISIKDNGKGMDSETLSRVQDPFFTTRTTRSVGLGIPLFKMSAELTGGGFRIESAPGAGTLTEAKYVYSHIDRAPLGDMAATISTLVGAADSFDLVYRYSYNDRSFYIDTREMREVLGDIPITSPEITAFVQSTVQSETRATENTKGD